MIAADLRTDLYNPNAIRASLGTLFTVPTVAATTAETLAWLRQYGLRIFAGPVAQRDVFAAPWTPALDLARADEGELPPEIVWAALDCPTSIPVANDPGVEEFKPIVLARLAAIIRAPVRAGETYTIVSWPIAFDGRKRHAGAALYAPSGEVLAVSRALWIELKPA